MTIPPLSDEQRQQARHAATEARRRRAEIKQALRSGERSLAEVLELAEQDDVIAHAKVIDVLQSLPRVGAVRATKVMERLDIAANRRLRGLGKHQTAALIAEFAPPPGQSPTSVVSRLGLTVVSGPTAVGKGTVVARLSAEHPEIFVSVSATTRPPRPGEVDGVALPVRQRGRVRRADRQRRAAGVGRGARRHRYGTPRAPVLAALASGRPALLEIDLQGARQVRASWPDAQFVFLAPPSLGGAGPPARRPGHRDRPSSGQRRLETARAEMAAQRRVRPRRRERRSRSSRARLGSLGPSVVLQAPRSCCTVAGGAPAAPAT